jgi:hypothetical protein
MLVCDFCADPTLRDIATCRCNHCFCDSCAHVSCGDDAPKFSSCTFCPKCVVECVTSNHEAAVELAKSMEEEDALNKPPPPPPAKPEPPSEFVCPITRDLMKDPIVLSDGFTYERTSACTWLSQRMVSPMTGAPVANALMPNTVLRVMINEWKERHNVVDA